jgi:hypothetical protein
LFNTMTAVLVAAVVFAFRVAAWRRYWYVPLAVRGWQRNGSTGGESRGGD